MINIAGRNYGLYTASPSQSHTVKKKGNGKVFLLPQKKVWHPVINTTINTNSVFLILQYQLIKQSHLLRNVSNQSGNPHLLPMVSEPSTWLQAND